MNKPRILFQVEGGAQTGYGHISRCTALAGYLKEDFDCHFLLPVETRERLSLFGTDQYHIHWTENSAYSLEELKLLAVEGDLLVVDGYSYDRAYFESLRPLGVTSVRIDDYYQDYSADAIINPSPAATRGKYPAMPYRAYAVGAAYAMLRPAFFEAKPVEVDARTLLVCLGGSDARFSAHLIEMLQSVGGFDRITWLGYLSEDSRAKLDELNEWKHVAQANAHEMVNLMTRHEYGLFSAGTLALEACTVGIPMLLLQYVENQKENYRKIVEEKAAVGIGTPETLDREVLQKSFDELKGQKQQVEFQKKLMDAHPPTRFRKLFNYLHLTKSITLRQASEKDVDLFYQWANDPDTRQNSTQSEPIPYPTHVSWFASKIRDVNTRIYVFEHPGGPVGYLRLEQREGHWLISYAMDPEFRGKGLGKFLIGRGMTEFIEEKQDASLVFHAWVKKSNLASAVTFKNCNFDNLKEVNLEGVTYDIFIWK
ncbi:UDP-2,4-diacetamido-2,4,6-trideoxy-beta-L-altropyranose hydrolase [bacterium SCSIO 12741]|nr:UDP-2,4-diacetamido-2,4,6-trideoxy-beta-L-altropyranose hydrolase [bacterium SCSIO 12741]